MTNQYLFPAEWCHSKLDDLFSHVIGGDWGKDSDFDDPDFIEARCIRGTEFKNWDKEKGLTAVRRKVKKSSIKTRKLMTGDILVEISGGGPDQPVGRTVLIDNRVISQHNGKDIVCTNFLRLARPVTNICPYYLNGFLRNFYLSGEIIKYQGGSNNLRNLKFKEYSTINIPLPPLAEQKEIATLLDNLLAQVDTLKTRLDAIPNILKRFRQSVLAAAVSGKLTIPITQWETKFLEKLSQSISDGDHQAPPKANIGIPFLVISNISRGHINFENIERFVPHDYFDALKEIRKPRRNDILYTVTGSFGIPVLVDTDKDFSFQRHIAIIKPKHELINFNFLKIALSSHFVFSQAENIATGTAQKTVPLSGLRKLKIPFPSIEEQTEIVGRVEELFAFADQIEQRVKVAQQRVNHLTQAILAKAFRGELTAEWREQNPDLISGENSAAALLARIQAEQKLKQVLAKPTRRQPKSLELDTTDFKFDREEANQR